MDSKRSSYRCILLSIVSNTEILNTEAFGPRELWYRELEHRSLCWSFSCRNICLQDPCFEASGIQTLQDPCVETLVFYISVFKIFGLEPLVPKFLSSISLC